MRAIVQRVKKASVQIGSEVKNSIGRGILVLCAFREGDDEKKIKWAAERISKLRIFRDLNHKLNRSVSDEKGEALVVSNFTLYGNCAHGTRPDFSKSANFQTALPMYEMFVRELNKRVPTKTGEFGGDMTLEIVADGPVTVVVDN
ncbi:MAG: D-aminoacyl-tRNA deacylase [Bacillota bacterium]|jgi:D-tyrosyl-tRNA(Tyr) deacylase|nr:D-aminoacyl-tRNA deacylase [Bacillota bacterium]HHU43764.1 D-tyrosyl-tRNA(Tyr) deacylase [Clostridiales bacterium]